MIIADSRCPRDGRFIEIVGTYDPLLSDDHPDRVRIKIERINYWKSVGAVPSERVAKLISKTENES